MASQQAQPCGIHVEYEWLCHMESSGKQVECANTFHVFISRVLSVSFPSIIHVNEPRVFHELMTPMIHVNKPRVFHMFMSPIIHMNKPHVFQVLMSPIIHVNKPRVLHWCKSGILLINCLFNSPFLHFHLWHLSDLKHTWNITSQITSLFYHGPIATRTLNDDIRGVTR